MKHCLKQRAKNKDKNTCLVKVTDDWFPNVDGLFVRVTFHPEKARPPYQKQGSFISICGDDDFGMIKMGCDEEEFKKICKTKDFSKEKAKSMGFAPDC